MDSSNLVASKQEVKTVFPWDERPEPWRTIGREFAAECRRIIAGIIAPPKPSTKLPMPNDLRQLREALGMSQREVGQLVGTSHQQVSFAEYGKRPKWQRIIRAALEGMQP